MELQAFLITLKHLEHLLPLITHFCADGDATISKALRQANQSISVSLDPGHLTRNLLRSLLLLAKSNHRLKSLSYRIGKFFIRLIKRCTAAPGSESERYVAFTQLAIHIIPHYSRPQCPESCPCNEFYQNSNNSESDDSDRESISPIAEDTNNIDVEEIDTDEEDSDLEAEYLTQQIGETLALISIRDESEDVDSENMNSEEELEQTNVTRTVPVIEEEVVGPDAFYPFPSAATSSSSSAPLKPRLLPKVYLDPQSPVDRTFLEEAEKLLTEAIKKAEATMSGLHTCETELEHKRRLKWLGKHLFFSLAYELRSLTCSAVGNIGQSKVYSLFCRALQIPEDSSSLKVFEKKDDKLVKDQSRRKTLKFRIQQKSLQAGRIQELQEEKQADAQNKLIKDSYKRIDQKIIELPAKRPRRCGVCHEVGHYASNPLFHPKSS